MPFLLAPMAESMTGQAAPTPMPRITGKAVAKVSAPVTDSACMIPMEAEALCSMAVITMPSSMPRNGLENMVTVRVKTLLSLSGETAALIVCMPTIRTAKPSRMLPRFLYTLLFESIRHNMPAMAATALMVEDESSFATPAEPSI